MDTNQPDDGDQRPAGDLLVGANAIKTYLVDLGWPATTDVYYLRRSGWPIGSTSADGGKLVATNAKLAAHTRKLASAS